MTNSLSSRDVIDLLKQDGWFQVGVTGDHFHFKHVSKAGKVTVPHPRKDIAIGTLKSIERQAQLNMRRR
jgi:predicted RNA binding protein YcfA (HicA-like mRNA interferase family)